MECSNEKSHKFYELKTDETSIIANFGRIGSRGAIKIYHFTNTTEKEVFYLKILKSKSKKGYSEAVKDKTFLRPRGMNPKQLQIPFY